MLSSESNPKVPNFFDRRPDETAERANRVSTPEEIEALFDAAIARRTMAESTAQ